MPKRIDDEEPIFDEDDEDYEQEEADEKSDSSQDDMFDEEEESSSKSVSLPKRLPPQKKGQKPALPRFMAPDKRPIKAVPESVPKPATPKFVAFSSPMREGIVDGETGEVIAQTIWEALAEIYNKLEEIHESIGKM